MSTRIVCLHRRGPSWRRWPRTIRATRQIPTSTTTTTTVRPGSRSCSRIAFPAPGGTVAVSSAQIWAEPGRMVDPIEGYESIPDAGDHTVDQHQGYADRGAGAHLPVVGSALSAP